MTNGLIVLLLGLIVLLGMQNDKLNEQNKALRFEIGLCREGKR